MPLVQISQLDFAYADQLVLKRIDLDVEPGTTLGLIGPNGGGKSTLLRLLLGLHAPTHGSIRIDGLPPARAVARGDLVGYLPQSPRLAGEFPINVRQTVRLGLAGKTGILRRYAQADLRFVESLLERMELAELATSPLGELSGGRLQRVFIARALAARPKLLLLDEPTTGIDRIGQKQFIELIQALQRDLGLTIILASHDLRAVSSVSDRIACLNLTLHYHDTPQHLPAELVYRMFACDLEAFGIHEAGGRGDPHPSPPPEYQGRGNGAEPPPAYQGKGGGLPR
jgi:zinc transport system ATP-binding protein